MSAANASDTETQQTAVIVCAAMDLLDCGWAIEAIADVLKCESAAWLETAIADAIAETERGPLN